MVKFEEVSEIFEKFKVFMNDKEMIWYKKAWELLEQTDINICKTDTGINEVYLRAFALINFYREFISEVCEESWDISELYWENTSLDLESNTQVMIDEEQEEERVKELVEKLVELVIGQEETILEALKKGMGGKEKLLASLVFTYSSLKNFLELELVLKDEEDDIDDIDEEEYISEEILEKYIEYYVSNLSCDPELHEVIGYGRL